MWPHVLVVEETQSCASSQSGASSWRTIWATSMSCANDGTSMRRILAQSVVDLVLLDLKLPGEDGFMLARELRATSSAPIMLVSSRNGEADRVLGLELGADDYPTKPFSARELVARTTRFCAAAARIPPQRAMGPHLKFRPIGSDAPREHSLSDRRLAARD